MFRDAAERFNSKGRTDVAVAERLQRDAIRLAIEWLQMALVAEPDKLAAGGPATSSPGKQRHLRVVGGENPSVEES